MDLLQQAKDVLESCLKNCRNNSQIEFQKEKLDTLTVFHDYFSKNRDALLDAVSSGEPVVPPVQTPPDPSVTPMKISTKPAPRYTDKARDNGVQGQLRWRFYFRRPGA